MYIFWRGYVAYTCSGTWSLIACATEGRRLPHSISYTHHQGTLSAQPHTPTHPHTPTPIHI